jgi:ATP-dependent Lon protease
VAAVCRYVARNVVEDMEKKEKENTQNGLKNKFTLDVSQDVLREVLGRKHENIDLELRTSNPGVAIGLAYTLNGGAITLIETTKFIGKGEILITGNMGDIMKESVTTGISWIKTNTHFLGLEKFDFSQTSLHVHVPEAAVPKDGPSAGVTIIISIVSP